MNAEQIRKFVSKRKAREWVMIASPDGKTGICLELKHLSNIESATKTEGRVLIKVKEVLSRKERRK